MNQQRAEEVDESRAALVCEHVASGAQPIQVAHRIDPVEEIDSGWQFFCGLVEDEDPAKAKVWSLNDVLEEVPSIRPFLYLAPGAELVREGETWLQRV